MVERAEYDRFVAASWHRLLRTAYLLGRDWAAAEDLMQTALLSGDPEAYVRRIIINVHVSWWRRRWRRTEVTTGSPPDSGEAADRIGEVDEREVLWQALQRLPARQRAVVVLRFFEDLTETQAAEVLGCGVGTVKSQTSRALAKLRIDETFVSTYETRR